MRRKSIEFISVLVIICVAAGCAWPRRNLSLENAQAAYNQAQRDSLARKYAPQALDEARRYLEKAQAEWQNESSESNVYFYADLSRRYSEAALLQGANAAASAKAGISE